MTSNQKASLILNMAALFLIVLFYLGFFSRKNVCFLLKFHWNVFMWTQMLITQHQCQWWRHQMEHFPRYTSPLWGEFTGHRWIPLTKASDTSFDVFFDLRLNKQFSKPSRHWWCETPSCSLWRQRDDCLYDCWPRSATPSGVIKPQSKI